MTERLGRYRLMKLLATGGMGEVFLALQEGPANFSKTVVIKRILRHLASDQNFIDLFLNEAKLAAQLQHPNIAQVFGLEHENDSWFIAMEYVHGRSLRDVITSARAKGLKIPPRLAARLASQALQALHFAHELTDSRGKPLGILHRDVSPENVLVSFSGDVKLVDFGLAKAMTGTPSTVGRPRGKLAYMAPELTVPGAVIDRRADIYAMGVLLVEAVTLAVPANTPQSVEAAQGPRRSWEPDPSIPPGLAAVIARALAIETRHRFETAAQMAEALEAWLAASAQAVVPNDVIVFLEALFGLEAIDFNEGVMLGSDALVTTGVYQRRAGGTEPLSQPLVPSDPNQRQAEKAPAAPTSGFFGWPIAIGVITALVLGFVLLAGLWPRPFAPPRPTPVVVVAVEDAGPPSAPAVPDAAVAAIEPVDAGAPRPVVIAPIDVPMEAPRRTGRVVFKVRPSCEVFLDGKSLGKTPLAPQTVPAGMTVFVLKNRRLGVTRKVSVKVPAGGLATVRADLSHR